MAFYCTIIKTYWRFQREDTSVGASDDSFHLAYHGNFLFVADSPQRSLQCVYTFVLYKLRAVYTYRRQKLCEVSVRHRSAWFIDTKAWFPHCSSLWSLLVLIHSFIRCLAT